jgi:thiol-disulfide isomerase/thioredoxin
MSEVGPPGPEAASGRAPRRARLRFIVGGVVVLASAAGVVAVLRHEHVAPGIPQAARACGRPRALVPVGGQLPLGCKVQSLTGGQAVSLSRYAAGKPMVINFWASWCDSCVQEMPALQSVYAAAGGRVQFLGLDLLGVDGEVRSGAESFARQRAVAYPLAFDDGGLLYGRISLRVLPPTTAFIRPDGTLAGFEVGELTAPELRQDIQRYLGVQVAA